MRSFVQKYVVRKYELLASYMAFMVQARVSDGAENDECTNASQLDVVETIYYPRRGIYL